MNDFDAVINRKNTYSFKWDHVQAIFNTDDILPMWVADMDFKAPDVVNEAIKQRAEHGVYGYTVIDPKVKQLVIDWVKDKHRWEVDVDTLSFSPGVITSIYTAIEAFTNVGDKILIQTPVYTPFFHLVRNSNRKLVENPLIYNGGKYEIDFADLEEKMKNGVKAIIFCSPHNPVGRVWTKEELEKIVALCEKYDTLIFSDEIHADLVFPNYQHIPIASISDVAAERTITFMSPTKTFNLAGLQASFIVTTNQRRKKIIDQRLGLQGFNMLNTIGILALEAAYRDGKQWLDELMTVLEKNKRHATKRLEEETDGLIKVIDSEATYLLWLDCKRLELCDKELQSFMINEAKVGLNAGSSYGKEGEQFMRINIACPKETLDEGIDRIVYAIKRLNENNS